MAGLRPSHTPREGAVCRFLILIMVGSRGERSECGERVAHPPLWRRTLSVPPVQRPHLTIHFLSVTEWVEGGE